MPNTARENTRRRSDATSQGSAQNATAVKLSAAAVNGALRVIRGKWKPKIILALSSGSLCYGELRRVVSRVTKKVLTEQLRELERERIVARRTIAQRVVRVEYSLTEHGMSLIPILEAIDTWGKRHSEFLDHPFITSNATMQPQNPPHIKGEGESRFIAERYAIPTLVQGRRGGANEYSRTTDR